MKKFDILKEVTDASGMKRQIMEQGVMAFDRKQLVEMYDMTGEKIIQILREFSDHDSQEAGKAKLYGKEDAQRLIAEMEHTPMAGGAKVDTRSLEELLKQDTSKFLGGDNANVVKSPPGPGDQPPTQQPLPQPPPQQHLATPAPAAGAGPVAPPRLPPKYFNIGGIDVKEDNGKIYQKQWCTIPVTEMRNYRVISDATNKIIPMTGKHIEVRKWVLVQDTDDENMMPTESEDTIPAASAPEEVESAQDAVEIEVVPNKKEEGKLING